MDFSADLFDRLCRRPKRWENRPENALFPGFRNCGRMTNEVLDVEELSDKNRHLPVLEKVLSLFEQLEEDGGANYGTQALIKVYENMKF